MYDLFGSENDVMIIYLSQAWLPDSSKSASDIVGAVHFPVASFWRGLEYYQQKMPLAIESFRREVLIAKGIFHF